MSSRANDLVALTPEAAEITRLPYAPEYRERETSRGCRRPASCLRVADEPQRRRRRDEEI